LKEKIFTELKEDYGRIVIFGIYIKKLKRLINGIAMRLN